MKLGEMKDSPLWGILPAGVKKIIDAAESEGWELNGKGVTLAIRLDRGEPWDLPAYVCWQVGVTPTGKVSFTSGKGGTMNQPLTATEMIDYLSDPTVVYPVQAHDEPEGPTDNEEGKPSALSHEEILELLGATVVETTPESPASPPSSGITAPTVTAKGLRVGMQSAAPSTTTPSPLRVGTKR